MAEVIAPPRRPGIDFHFQNVGCFRDIGIQVAVRLRKIKESGKEIVFVAGPIGSVGRTTEEDMDHLFDLTRKLEAQGFAAFSSGNFFPAEFWNEWKEKLPEFKYPEKGKQAAFDELSREILSSMLCDRIYMARDSSKSEGATKERKIAEKLKMRIVMEEVKNDPL